MAAREAVFNTVELLKHIISLATPQSIRQAKKVSKTRRSLIKQSPKIRSASVMSPTLRLPADAVGKRAVPCYSEDESDSGDLREELKIHPDFCTHNILWDWSKCLVWDLYSYESCYINSSGKIVVIHEGSGRQKVLQADIDHFVFSPPCDTVRIEVFESGYEPIEFLQPDGLMLSNHRRYRGNLTSTLLHVKEGVRIRDVIDEIESKQQVAVSKGCRLCITRESFLPRGFLFRK